MKKPIITISSIDKKQFFFTTDHCQKHNLGEDWVSCSSYLPIYVVPRAVVPDGWVKTKEQYKSVFYYNYEEIPNPNPAYQA
jgi:hypothetical protein